MASRRRDYDYIVVGLGGIGAGAVYWLSRRAKGDVLGLEQFELGHVRGASQDHSRIIRLSYHTAEYVRLAQLAYEAWATLEREAGESLIVRTGGLDFGPPGGAISLADYIASMESWAVPFEMLSAGEIMRRWPVFRLTDDIAGLYQHAAGIVPAARCNAAHLRLARANGAVLLHQTPVTHIRPVGGEVELVAGDGIYRCRQLIIANGAWSNHTLAHFGLRLPLTITQEQVTYYATPHLEAFQPDRFPVWIWMDDPCFYGFPVYGEPAVKAAQDVGGREVTADTRSFEPDPATLGRLTNFLSTYLPDALGPILYTKTCLYTLTPDRDFVIDSLPEHPNIRLAIGAGHAFKFASLIGRILAELALDGITDCALDNYRFSRPILTMENPPKNFMV